jgi:hypothetical protein
LEDLKFVEGAVEGVAEGAFVAEEFAEGVGGAVAGEDLAEEGGVLQILLFGGGGGGRVRDGKRAVLAEVVEAGGNETFFDAGDAAEAPLGGGHLGDEELLEIVGGLEADAEGVEELLEFARVLLREDGVAGEESVLAGVAAAAGLAWRGLGAGAALGVLTIGGELAWRGHGTPLAPR